jgi:dolichyl-phosphate-mannose--protein O-mannosyl transferase
MERFILTLKRIETTARAVKQILWRYTERDVMCVLALLVVTVVLRVPFIGHPPVTQYDEVKYANYAMHLLDKRPFVDIHPPLARMIFAETARTSEPFLTRGIDMTFNAPFGYFPMAKERTLVALFGIMLPLLLYMIARTLGYSPRAALLTGLFIATDNGMIIFSRAMLPDMLLLVFDFLAVLLALFAVRARTKTRTYAFALGTGLAIGLALSTKWTAALVAIVIAIFFMLHKRYGALMLVATVSGIVYVSIFTAALMLYFPSGGHSSNFAVESDTTKVWVANADFPKIESARDALAFLPTLHAIMMHANNDPLLLDSTLRSQGAYSWPIARNAMVFWSGSESKTVTLTGNSSLWTMSFFALLFDLLWIATVTFRTRKSPVSKDEIVLIFGYLVNYLPFLFVHRPMYLYHYFAALIFLVLLLPKIAPRITDCLATTTRDRLFARVFMASAIVLIFVSAILSLPSTYGA